MAHCENEACAPGIFCHFLVSNKQLPKSLTLSCIELTKNTQKLDANVYHIAISLTYYMLAWPMCPDLLSFLRLKLS
jgi:hypothetical protein